MHIENSSLQLFLFCLLNCIKTLSLAERLTRNNKVGSSSRRTVITLSHNSKYWMSGNTYFHQHWHALLILRKFMFFYCEDWTLIRLHHITANPYPSPAKMFLRMYRHCSLPQENLHRFQLDVVGLPSWNG